MPFAGMEAIPGAVSKQKGVLGCRDVSLMGKQFQFYLA